MGSLSNLARTCLKRNLKGWYSLVKSPWVQSLVFKMERKKFNNNKQLLRFYTEKIKIRIGIQRLWRLKIDQPRKWERRRTVFKTLSI